MLRRHSEVPLYVTSLEVVKIKEVCIKNFSTVKYPTDTMYFSCVGHLGAPPHVICVIPVCRTSLLSPPQGASWPTLGRLIENYSHWRPWPAVFCSSNCFQSQVKHEYQGRAEDVAFQKLHKGVR